MRHVLTGSVALSALIATSAYAGGIDRNEQGLGFMFEDGSYAQVSLNYAKPDVTGVDAHPSFGAPTGNMAPSYGGFGIAYKQELQPGIDLGFYMTQPYGANAEYTAGLYTGLNAEWTSTEVGGILKYQANENISVYGGLRIVRSEMVIGIPDPLFPGGYAGSGDATTDVGYLVGAAYEIPDIALRASLTYRSAIDHDIATAESFMHPLAGPVTTDSSTAVTLPQSVSLDVQTGVNERTLVFGSIKWTDWSEFNISPAFYSSPDAAGGPLVSFDDDTWTYTLGAAYRVNEQWAVLGSISHEKQNDRVPSRLAPTDGYTSIGLGARYDAGNGMTVTGGIQYRMLGDVEADPGVNTVGTFEDNSAIGIGLTIGWAL